MLFNSLEYLIFLPLVLLLYFATGYRYRWLVLLVASYYFYMSWNAKYIFLIVFSSVVDYLCAGAMSRTESKRKKSPYLFASLLSNLGLLFAFKYYNFFSSELSKLLEFLDLPYHLPLAEILLPVGISFYTFQTMSYSIDVYNGIIKAERHPGVFALYVAFFPQLVAGPIERAGRLLGQFRKHQQFSIVNFRAGFLRILWGLFKKVVVADRLAFMVNEVFNNPESYHGFSIWVAAIFFAFEIYCDFSGYSDIAIGSARLFGIRLMENFRTPYFSKCISEFWGRWHISLSTWFRDYVYIPMGGNRTVKWRWYYNLIITFLVSGVWHGANWTFLVWGLLHGVYLVLERVFQPRTKVNSTIWLRILKMAWIFILVCIGWIIFRANNMTDAFLLLKQSINGSFVFVHNVRGQELYFGQPMWRFLGSMLLIAILVICDWRIYSGSISEKIIMRWKTSRRWALSYLLILVILMFGVFELNEFIYFQF